MKNILIFGILFASFLFASFLFASFFFPLCAEAENVTIYVVPAITDNKILPKSSIPSSYISDTISVKASPGEFEPASFVIRADQDVNSMTIESTDLTGSGGIIHSADVDIRTVKCWYQGSSLSNPEVSVQGKYLTPELLLKDDSLIRVTGDDWTKWDSPNPKGENELKLTDGSYTDISSDTPQNRIVPISERPVIDAATLQPLDLPDGYNKQFWITIKVPNDASAGSYTGTITLKTGAVTIQTIKLNLQVLPIKLSNPKIEYSVYYRGMITDDGSISSSDKTIAQFTAEQKNMLAHGVTNPTIFPTPSDDLLTQILTIRNQVGLDNTNLYYYFGSSGGEFGNANKFPYYINLTAPYEVTNIYSYGPDEENINTVSSRSKMTAIHKAGGKVMDAQSLSQADSVADILDLAIVAGDPSMELANKYHSYDHKIYSYANPQVVPEYPRLFRMNYGLLLWQRNYDGAMNYAYQDSYGDIWNDFDNELRDHVFAYPTMNGAIDTIQWEGYREGVDDMRYLTTLQNTIRLAKSQGKDTSAAESWLANLKDSDLTSQDLNAVRLQMINYILSLQDQLGSTTTSPITTTTITSASTLYTSFEYLQKPPL